LPHHAPGGERRGKRRTRQVEGFEDVVGPGPCCGVEEERAAGLAPIGRERAGEPPGDVIARLQPDVRAGKDVRLVPPYPQDFGSDVEGFGVLPRAAMNSLAAAQSLAPLPGFTGGAVVLVDDAAPQ